MNEYNVIEICQYFYSAIVIMLAFCEKFSYLEQICIGLWVIFWFFFFPLCQHVNTIFALNIILSTSNISLFFWQQIESSLYIECINYSSQEGKFTVFRSLIRAKERKMANLNLVFTSVSKSRCMLQGERQFKVVCTRSASIVTMIEK